MSTQMVSSGKGKAVKTEQAIAHIERLVFLPGWWFEPSDYTDRQEGCVKVRVYCPNPNLNAESLVGDDYTIPPDGKQDFVVTVGDLADSDYETLEYRILTECLAETFVHEAREALRDHETKVATFHPHRVKGQTLWAKHSGRPIILDKLYGLA